MEQELEQKYNKYVDGKVYKLVNTNSDKIYIGSTTRSLKQRLNGHKSNFNMNHNISSKKLFEIDGIVSILLLEAFPCNSKKELTERERYYIEMNKDIVANFQIPTRTHQEYYEANKEKIIEQHKEYKAQNKEKLKQYFKDRYEKNKEQFKVYNANQRSSDGYKEKQKEYMNQYYSKNKDELLTRNKEYRQDNKDDILKKKKQYYEANKEKLLEKMKLYNQENKEKRKEYLKQYRKDNKERIKEQKKEWKLKQKLINSSDESAI